MEHEAKLVRGTLVDQLLQHQKCLNIGILKCDFIDAPSAVSECVP
jgi:hypothetical protein